MKESRYLKDVCKKREGWVCHTLGRLSLASILQNVSAMFGCYCTGGRAGGGGELRCFPGGPSTSF